MLRQASSHEENRDIQKRIVWFFGVIAILLLTLLLRAGYFQIIHGDAYFELSENNRIRMISVPASRGIISDRNGTPLVNNALSFNLYMVPADIPSLPPVIERLSSFVEMQQEELIQIMAQKREDAYLPIKIKNDLSMKEIALIEGHSLELPGVKIEAEFKRSAIYGSLAAHLLGYIGEVSQAQLDSGVYDNVRPSEMIGRSGVEQSYDGVIRGVSGQKGVEVDALGHEIRILNVKEPVQGDSLYLTIDLNLQQVAEEALGGRVGAIVAMDPNNGEVLAMVSHPTFDPNILSRGPSPRLWNDILQDEEKPLNNRATQGQYPPGSTFKIVLAAAILETKTASPAQQVHCRGYYPFGNRNFMDWKKGGHGAVDLHRALVESCDVYFYEMGTKLGIDPIAKFAGLLGLGEKTGIALQYEKKGLIPSTTWKKRVRHEPWYPGETVSVAIGQGYVSVTPLQMARMISTVANDGISYPPQLVLKKRQYDTGFISEFPPRPGETIPISKKTLEIVKNGLIGVVNEPHGTAGASQSQWVSMAGKTGTAQVVAIKERLRSDLRRKLPPGLDDHAWFVAYAPVDTPKIAMAILVEHGGHGGSVAAPIAKKLIEAYLKNSAPK